MKRRLIARRRNKKILKSQGLHGVRKILMYTAQLYASCSYMVVTEKIDGRGDDDEQDLDGQACKGRALHHQGLVDCR